MCCICECCAIIVEIQHHNIAQNANEIVCYNSSVDRMVWSTIVAHLGQKYCGTQLLAMQGVFSNFSAAFCRSTPPAAPPSTSLSPSLQFSNFQIYCLEMKGKLVRCLTEIFRNFICLQNYKMFIVHMCYVQILFTKFAF